jgi:hypothetical protein
MLSLLITLFTGPLDRTRDVHILRCRKYAHPWTERVCGQANTVGHTDQAIFRLFL